VLLIDAEIVGLLIKRFEVFTISVTTSAEKKEDDSQVPDKN
jgi:hypothetical protein